MAGQTAPRRARNAEGLIVLIVRNAESKQRRQGSLRVISCWI
jgi:hypothetical protein